MQKMFEDFLRNFGTENGGCLPETPKHVGRNCSNHAAAAWSEAIWGVSKFQIGLSAILTDAGLCSRDISRCSGGHDEGGNQGGQIKFMSCNHHVSEPRCSQASHVNRPSQIGFSPRILFWNTLFARRVNVSWCKVFQSIRAGTFKSNNV